MSRQYSVQQQVGPGGGPPNNDWNNGRGDRTLYGSGFQSQMDLSKSPNPSRPGTVTEEASNLGYSPSGMNLRGQASSQALFGPNSDPRQSSILPNSPSGMNLTGQGSSQAISGLNADPRQSSVFNPSSTDLRGQADPRQSSVYNGSNMNLRGQASSQAISGPNAAPIQPSAYNASSMKLRGQADPRQSTAYNASSTNLRGQASSQAISGSNTDPRQSSAFNASSMNVRGQTSSQVMLLIVLNTDSRQPSILPNDPYGMNLLGEKQLGPNADLRPPFIAAYSPSGTNIALPQSRQGSMLPNSDPRKLTFKIGVPWPYIHLLNEYSC